MADAERFHWKLTLALWTVLLVGSMGIMLFTAAHKTIVIADAGYGQESIAEQAGAAKRAGKLLLQAEAAEENTFYIEINKDDKAENVTVENCYLNRELRVHIKNADEAFYDNLALRGDIAAILSAYWESKDSGVVLRLKMNGIYEYQNSMEGDRLKIRVCMPHDLYGMIAVIDPSGGGTGPQAGNRSEKTVALALSERIPDQVKNDNIRLYFTRMEDVEASEEERCALAQAVQADIFINIGATESEDSSSYGIRGIYDEEYFIPGLGNVQLADALVRNVAMSCKNRGVGLYGADQDSILRRLRIPAARVEVGYLSNEQEAALLGQEEYLKRQAEGIARAIEEVYETYYE